VAPQDRVAAVGDTVTFECVPRAWPEPRIQWRHNGRLIEPEQFRLADGSAKYAIGRIGLADLNIGGGGGRRGGDLTNGAETLAPINGKPRPTSTSVPYTASQASGNQMALGAGSPAGRDGQLVDWFGSQLTIKQADKGDEGRYSCLVETKGSHRLIERESPGAQLTAYGELSL
jgi:hypothetical protein